MKKQYIPLYIGLLTSAAPLLSADQKPTQIIMQPEANVDITKYVFGCTPPFCTRHINEVAHEEHTVDVERFKPLQTNALESIETRLIAVRTLRTAYASLDTESAQQVKAQLKQAKEALKQAQQTIGALATKCGNDKATITTQDILRCAQWAKTLEPEDNYVDLTFHNGNKFSTSCRVLGPNGAVGHVLSHHEWIERSQYGPEVAGYATTGVDSGEIKDANMDFSDEVTYETCESKVRPFVWGEGKEPSQAIIDEFVAKAKKGPQKGIASLPVETVDGTSQSSDYIENQ